MREEEGLFSWEVPEAPEYTDYIPKKSPGAQMEGGVYTFRNQIGVPVGGIGENGDIYGFKNISVSENIYAFNVNSSGDVKTKTWIRAKQGLSTEGRVFGVDYMFHGDQKGVKAHLGEVGVRVDNVGRRCTELERRMAQAEAETAKIGYAGSTKFDKSYNHYGAITSDKLVFEGAGYNPRRNGMLVHVTFYETHFSVYSANNVIGHFILQSGSYEQNYKIETSCVRVSFSGAGTDRGYLNSTLTYYVPPGVNRNVKIIYRPTGDTLRQLKFQGMVHAVYI